MSSQITPLNGSPSNLSSPLEVSRFSQSLRADHVAQLPPVPLNVAARVSSRGDGEYEAPVYDTTTGSLLSNADFRIVMIGRERAVRIDHLESYKEGAGHGTFNLGVVAKWAEENGISRVVVQAGNQVKAWYGKPPRNFVPSSGVTRDGSSFNMEVRVPGPLTWWITTKPAPRS